MLDYKYDVWLIEVNLSPACAERADWLTEMLDAAGIPFMGGEPPIGLIKPKMKTPLTWKLTSASHYNLTDYGVEKSPEEFAM